jgi:D-alanyl-D-alanine carboxypeptidase/D-alanyl-D-alanine-endopeptidase (penicillin-binding protein 4)
MQTRRGVLAGIGALLAGPVWAKGDAAAEIVAAEIIAAAKLGGDVAFVLADKAGVLTKEQADLAMPPASVTKVVTTLYALDRLGAEHRFVTRILAVGEMRGDTLEGDLILAGGGDPTLDTDRLGDLAAALAKTGLRAITGRYFFFENALPYHFEIAPDQPDHVGYNPAVSGLMLNYNRVNFVWARANDGWAVEMNAEGARFIPKVRAAKVSIAARDLPLFAYEADKPQETWSVAAQALGKGGSRWLPLRHPAPYAAEVFQTLCAAQGITLPEAQSLADLPENATLMAQDHSAPLAAMLQKMLKYSTNITAEAIGLTASHAANQAQSAQRMTDWAQSKFGIKAVFGDHSGLGPITHCTAGDMVKILRGARDTRTGRILPDLLRETELASSGQRGRILAKSGTMNFVSALAGYLRLGEKTLIFVIFAADAPRRAAVPIADREEPKGSSAWTKRARKMQRALLSNWAERFF